jgi:hypothetical protein
MGFKVNDWVLCCYKIQQVIRVENGLVKEVSDGYFSHSGHDLKCWPLTLETKNWAEFVAHHADEIYQLRNNSCLNLPDIVCWLENKFNDGSEALLKGRINLYNACRADVMLFFKEVKTGLFGRN